MGGADPSFWYAEDPRHSSRLLWSSATANPPKGEGLLASEPAVWASGGCWAILSGSPYLPRIEDAAGAGSLSVRVISLESGGEEILLERIGKLGRADCVSARSLRIRGRG